MVAFDGSRVMVVMVESIRAPRIDSVNLFCTRSCRWHRTMFLPTGRVTVQSFPDEWKMMPLSTQSGNAGQSDDCPAVFPTTRNNNINPSVQHVLCNIMQTSYSGKSRPSGGSVMSRE